MLKNLAFGLLSISISSSPVLILAGSSPAAAAGFQTFQAADAELGQPDFTNSAQVVGQPGRLANPSCAAYDPTTGKVFVADRFNNRILRFSSVAASQNGANPEAVFGQPNFTAHALNQGGGSAAADTLFAMDDLTVDSQGRLWVADTGNNRVLGFYLASFLSNDPAPDIVLGQPNFTTTTSGTTQAKMASPSGLSVGPDDSLWVVDSSNNRVLRFGAVSSKVSGASADSVLGQASFISGAQATTPTGMSSPYAVWADLAGRLWVGDSGNYRVLRFDGAATKGIGGSADGVLGQPNLSTTSAPVADASHFSFIQGVYLDSTGTLWVSSYFFGRLSGFPDAASLAPGAAASIVLGQPDFTTSTPGVASVRSLGGPSKIGPGPNGSMFVADLANNRVLRFSPASSATPTAAPTIHVSGKKKLTTASSRLLIKGSTSGSVTSVTYRLGRKNGTVSGTTAWKFTARLAPGKNVLSILAHGPGGDSLPTKTVIIRK